MLFQLHDVFELYVFMEIIVKCVKLTKSIAIICHK